MVGVVFVFVREDASDVEALAETFDQAGYTICGSEICDDALTVIVWSRDAMRSEAFCGAAERALRSDRVVVASLISLQHAEANGRAPVIDISAWNGADARALDPLFDAVRDIFPDGRSNVIELPARPACEDAEFTHSPLQIAAANECARRIQAAWEVPIPTTPINLAREMPPQRKLGAPSPRKDFRRLQPHNSNARAHAALVFAVVTLSAGSLLIAAAQNFSAAPKPQIHAAETGGVSLNSASAEAIGLEDIAPTERDRMIDPPVQVGRAGLEPPSARRASYQQ